MWPPSPPWQTRPAGAEGLASSRTMDRWITELPPATSVAVAADARTVPPATRHHSQKPERREGKGERRRTAGEVGVKATTAQDHGRRPGPPALHVVGSHRHRQPNSNTHGPPSAPGTLLVTASAKAAYSVAAAGAVRGRRPLRGRLVQRGPRGSHRVGRWIDGSRSNPRPRQSL